MRRMAALLVLLLPAIAHAETKPQLVLQLGASGQAGHTLNQPAMHVECVYAPFRLGGGWLEFGALGRKLPQVLYAFPAERTTVSAGGSGNTDQILELTTGLVVGPSGSDSFFPFVKLGAGMYRDKVYTSPLVFPTEPYLRFIPPPPSKMEWGAGMSLGVGARMGPPGGTSPMMEARYHLTRLDGNDLHQLLMVSAGVWFR